MGASKPAVSRRRLLAWAATTGTVGAAGAAGGAAGTHLLDGRQPPPDASGSARLAPSDATVAAAGMPVGLGDPIPAFGHLLAIDLTPAARQSPYTAWRAARRLFRDLTALARQAADGVADLGSRAPAALGTRPASLQVTPGIGGSLLDLCGLTDRRPAALTDLPAFVGDRLQPQLCGGDLAVQVGAEDPMRLAGAVQQIRALLGADATIRWSRTGFRGTTAAATDPAATARNLMGHRDGTNNPDLGSPLWETAVLVNDPGSWMHRGSYLVARRIRIDLTGWFDHDDSFRDQVIGRRTSNGAPLTGAKEHDPVDLDLRAGDGSPVIRPYAHIRLASSRNTQGGRIYRRSWNYDDGWTSSGNRDAGLLFLSWQADIRRGFLPIQHSLVAGPDALNAFTTHIGSATFAMPAMPASGYIAQALLES